MSHPFIHFDGLESRQHLTAVNFDIDSSLSHLTITATAHADHVGTVKLGSQADGLDTAALQGTLVADLSSKGVRFGGGSTIDAIAHSGSFSPGDKPADFAVDGKVKKIITLATMKAAVRDLSLDFTASSRKAITGKDHRFLIRNGQIDVTGGTVDYKLDSKFGDADGSKSLADLSSDLANGHGRVTGKKGSRIITIPVEIQYKRDMDNDVTGTFTLKGQIVGRESTNRSPQAASFSTTAITAKRHDERSSTATILAL